MGEFQNITLGVGDFFIDGRDIGLTKGDATVSRSVETKDCEGGVPLQTQGRVIIREEHVLKIPVVELTMKNLSDVALNVPETVVPGTPQTVLDGDDQERTFTPLSGGAVEFIRLDGPNITGLTIKDQTEVTTYVDGTDYFADTLSGIVYRAPGGSIGSGETVRVDYGYTPNASSRLNFGVNLPVQTKEVMFTHVSPVSGNIFTVFMPEAQFSGQLEANFQEEEFLVINAEVKAVPSDLFPASPLGYWDLQVV